VSRPGEGEEWWKTQTTSSNNSNNNKVLGNSNEEQMEVNGDSPDMPSLETGSLAASNSSDSPTSETSTGPNIQVEVRKTVLCTGSWIFEKM
jgi:hypothetical protein